MPGTVTLRPILAKLGDFTTALNESALAKSDSYCIAIIGKEHAESTVCKDGGKNPSWNDSLSVKRTEEEPYCFLEIKDKSLLKDKTLGIAAIDLEELKHGGQTKRWYELFHNKQPAGGILIEAEVVNTSSFDAFAGTNYTANGSVNLEEVKDGKEIAQNVPETFLRRALDRPTTYSFESTSLRSSQVQPQTEILQSVNQMDHQIDALLARSRQTEALALSSTQHVRSEGVHHIPNLSDGSNLTASNHRFDEELSKRPSKREAAKTFVRENYDMGVHYVTDKVNSLRRSEFLQRPEGQENRERTSRSERKISKERIREIGQNVMVGYEYVKENTKVAYSNLRQTISNSNATNDEGNQAHLGDRVNLLKDKMIGKIANLGKGRREIGTQTEESYMPSEVVVRRDLLHESVVEKARERLEVGAEIVKDAGHTIKDKVENYSTMEGAPMGRERKRDMAQRKLGEGVERLRLIAQGILTKLNENNEHELHGFEGETRQIRKREILKQKFTEGLDLLKGMMNANRSTSTGSMPMSDVIYEDDVHYNDIRGQP